MNNKTFTMKFSHKQLPYLNDAIKHYQSVMNTSDKKITVSQDMVLTDELSKTLKDALVQYRLHIFNSSNDPLEDETYDLAMLDSLVVRIEAAESGEPLD